MLYFILSQKFKIGNEKKAFLANCVHNAAWYGKIHQTWDRASCKITEYLTFRMIEYISFKIFKKVFFCKKIDPIWRKISNEKPVLLMWWCFQKLFSFLLWADIALAKKKVISLQKKQKTNETKSKEKENLANNSFSKITIESNYFLESSPNIREFHL